MPWAWLDPLHREAGDGDARENVRDAAWRDPEGPPEACDVAPDMCLDPTLAIVGERLQQEDRALLDE